MNAILTIARKELRAYFASPVALIFLAIFLVATLFSLFGYAGFFARNIADIRPFFEWLPLLLILLVAAITMRQWSEERKMGTLEVLLTLPVSIRDLVIGKFVAGIFLVVLALLLTLPVPMLVANLGALDWGPVLGGYVGAVLLAAAYLSIGLCVSGRTDNQFVALMTTLAIAGCLYLIGTDRFTSFFSDIGAELLRSVGTGSRFKSIERGVLDLRDFVYYVGMAVFFLTLNWYFLESERLDSVSQQGRARNRQLLALVGLVALNVLALNLWLAPVRALRVDVTESGDYSIDAVTIDTLHALDEPLYISGYFSDRTHPLLSPLVPQIKDLLSEYQERGGNHVKVDFGDPNDDEELEQELAERYSIRSVPFRIVDRHEQAVVNSFFHILIRYGDQFETLSFGELIEVRADDNVMDVRLRNLEYDLTRTIKRVSQDFQNMESVFAQLPGDAKLTLYVTPETLPSDFAELPTLIQKIVDELVEPSGGKLIYRVINPTGDEPLQRELVEKFDIRPLAVDLFRRSTFYLDLVLEAGDRVQRIMPRRQLSESDLRGAIEATIRRATPGQLKTVGIYTETPVAPPQNPQIPIQYQQLPPQPDFRALASVLGEDFRLETLDLANGFVPDVIDVMILAKVGPLTELQQFAIDQYLMRGGKLIVMAGRYAVAAERGGLIARAHPSPIFEMLETWGVTVENALVMDPQNAAFPIPVNETRGRFRTQRIQMLPYPFFADIRRDGFNETHPAFSGLQGLTTPWASPLEVHAREGMASEVLIETSSGSWLNSTGQIDPDMVRFPGAGWGVEGETGAQVVAVVLSGSFASHFADRPSPLFGGEGDEALLEVGEDGEVPDATGRTLKQSLPDAKLVVIGSSEISSDLVLALSQQIGGEVHRGNLQFVQNLLDWAVADTDLLAIRTPGAFARTLRPLNEGEAGRLELMTYGLVFASLIAVGLVARRLSRPAFSNLGGGQAS